MHKSFYASGFLYSLKTHQILLLCSKQSDQTNPSWSMLGGESTEGEEAHITFQRTINELVGLVLKTKDIYPIYDYFHEENGKINYVFYAEVKKAPKFDSLGDKTLTWVAFSEAPKLIFSPHTKQDLIVGERVINLKQRIDLNIQ